jgi:hypothetical protein
MFKIAYINMLSVYRRSPVIFLHQSSCLNYLESLFNLIFSLQFRNHSQFTEIYLLMNCHYDKISSVIMSF